jgi:hypothetical protein
MDAGSGRIVRVILDDFGSEAGSNFGLVFYCRFCCRKASWSAPAPWRFSGGWSGKRLKSSGGPLQSKTCRFPDIPENTDSSLTAGLN